MSDQIDLAELRAGFRDVLETEADADHVRRHVAGDALYDHALTSTVASLGWAGLAIAEADGGLGLGLPALAVLYEELGRGPAPLPLFPTLLAADALSEAPDRLRSAWLPRIAAGEIFAAYVPGAFEGDKMSGCIEHVLDGGAAELFVIGLEDGRCAAVPRGTIGLEVRPTPSTDRTRSLATLILDNVAIEPFSVGSSRLERHAALALACDSVGGADAILGKTVDYLNTRVQFGQPIGKFQALKHRVAEHKLRLEAARALTSHALGLEVADSRAVGMALLAQAEAVAAYAVIAGDSVQLHGGIGFTWEQECHHYLKRAWLNRLLFGGETQALDRAALLLAEAA